MTDNKSGLQVKCMPVNPIEMNLYVVYEKGGEGILIDPGCCHPSEFERLYRFVEQENIRLTRILLTHPHFDHFWGAAEICRHYGLPLEMHADAVDFMERAGKGAVSFGLEPVESPAEVRAFSRDETEWAGHRLEIRHTPGHCQGSVCYVLPGCKTVFTGDVLFNGSIGRTDLPTGDLDVLRRSIFNRLFVLDDDYVVRPGHGGRTSIGHEKYNNPFL